MLLYYGHFLWLTMHSNKKKIKKKQPYSSLTVEQEIFASTNLFRYSRIHKKNGIFPVILGKQN